MWAGVLFFLFCVGFVFYLLGQIHLKLRYHGQAMEQIMQLKLFDRKMSDMKKRRLKLIKTRVQQRHSIKESISIKVIPKVVGILLLQY